MLSRTPVRRGARYCAPACGRGCTYNEYLIALANAQALAKEAGAGWEPRVSENMGWHFSAKLVGMKDTLIWKRGGDYSLIANGNGGSIVTTGSSAKDAIREAREEAARRAKASVQFAKALGVEDPLSPI